MIQNTRIMIEGNCLNFWYHQYQDGGGTWLCRHLGYGQIYTSHISKFPAGDMLDLYLSRSKLSLFDIVFTQNGDYNRSYDLKETYNFTTLCLERLVPHATHWWQLVIAGVDVDPKAFSPLTGLYVPALERLVTNCDFGGVVDVFYMGAPLLSYVELKGVYFIPPLNTVTSLELQECNPSNPLSYNHFFCLISHMQSLTHLSMDGNVVLDHATTTHHIPPVKSHSILFNDFIPRSLVFPWLTRTQVPSDLRCHGQHSGSIHQPSPFLPLFVHSSIGIKVQSIWPRRIYSRGQPKPA